MNNVIAGKAFKSIVEKMSNLEGVNEMDIDGILMNWNNSELNETRDQIISYPGRDGAYSFGKEGGKVRISKKFFIEWILSDEPFNEKVYGKEIRNNKEWTTAIETARKSITEVSEDQNDNSIPERLEGMQRTILDLSFGRRKPQNHDERQLLKEIKEIEARGQMLDLPFD